MGGPFGARLQLPVIMPAIYYIALTFTFVVVLARTRANLNAAIIKAQQIIDRQERHITSLRMELSRLNSESDQIQSTNE